VLCYGLDKNANGPEPVLEVDREGTKTEVLARYPMFTADEATDLVDTVYATVKFTLHTPWVGVVAVDGKTTLSISEKGTSKSYREQFEAEQKKVGAILPRPVWRKVRTLLDASSEADFDEKYAEATKAALEARATLAAAAKSPPKALAERVDARVEALDKAGRERLEQANGLQDGKARDEAVARVRADFAGLPFLAAK